MSSHSHFIVIRPTFGSIMIIPATPDNMKAYVTIFKAEHCFRSLGYKEYIPGVAHDWPEAEVVTAATVNEWLAAGAAKKQAEEAKEEAAKQANYLIENEEPVS